MNWDLLTSGLCPAWPTRRESSTSKASFLPELKAIDWDFTGEPGTDGLAGFHWYPARFAEQIPSILTGYLSQPGDTVLDPFCGAGTALTEALRLNRRPIGIDINPVAVLMASAKLQDYTDSDLDRFAIRLTNRVQERLKPLEEGTGTDAEVPPHIEPSSPRDEVRLWFHSRTLSELDTLLESVGSEREKRFRTLGKACFSSILRACSSQDRHWGYICDNVRPKSLTYKNAVRSYARALNQFRRHYQDFRKLYDGQRKDSDFSVAFDDALIIEGDATTELRNLAQSSVSLVVTSPPYLNVTDYIDSQRLSLLWLYPKLPADRRIREIGARYKRFRQDSLSPYLAEMTVCLEQLARILTPGGYCCLILGESPSHPPFVDRLVGLLKRSEFSILARLDRHIAEKRSLSPRIMDETVIIARKEPQECNSVT